MSKAKAGPVPKTLMRGNLKCGACGTPLREHKGMGPCPFWEAGIVDFDDYMSEKSSRVRRMK